MVSNTVKTIGLGVASFAVLGLAKQHIIRKNAWDIAYLLKDKWYGKPILNVGASDGQGLNLGGPFWNNGDVNCDIRPQRNIDNFCLCDINDLSQFEDKEFSCVVASHIFEHKGVDAESAIAACVRVAHSVLIIVPWKYDVANWFRIVTGEHDKQFGHTVYVIEDDKPMPDVSWESV